MRIDSARALAWRMERQFLEPACAGEVDDVVARLVAVPAWSGDAQYAVGVRRERPVRGDVGAALADGRIVKVFAFRGSTQVLTPENAAIHLALRAASRMWERRSWQTHYDLTPTDWPALREAVREAVEAGPLTPAELAEAVTAHPGFRHLGPALSRVDTFLKPFFWQGDLCFGPSRDGEPTLQALGHNPRWTGMPDLDDAGRRAIRAYLAAYGPATSAHLQYWLGEGLGAGKRRIEGWLTDLGDDVTALDLDGAGALVLTEHANELAATDTTKAVRFLAGHDQWVLGPGTAAPQVVPPALRPAVPRGANGVISGGVVAGTWKVADETLAVAWSGPAGPPAEALHEQAERVGALLGRPIAEVRVTRVRL